MAIKLVGLDKHAAFIFRKKVVSVRMGNSNYGVSHPVMCLELYEKYVSQNCSPKKYLVMKGPIFVSVAWLLNKFM